MNAITHRLWIILIFLSTFALPDALWADSVCHFPPSGINSPHTIVVSPNAIAAHVAHGDAIGACGCSVSACDYTALVVQTGASGKQDGSTKNPFGSLTRALKFADNRKLQCVELQVGAGVYAEDVLSINQDTRILGADGVSIATPIKNIGAHSLTVEHVTFVAAAGSARSAIEVDNECASTTLHDVLFDGVALHGLSQNGGTLEIDDVTVQTTSLLESDPHSGAGVFLSGGVDACLTNMILDDNANGGLIAEGQGTRILVTESSVDNNLGCLAAFRVKDNALLLGQTLTLTGNVANGLWISDSGAAHFRDIDILQTMRPDGDICGFNVTFNALVQSNGLLELTSFSLRESALVGFGVRSVAHPPSIKDGCVNDSPFGVFYDGENVDADINCFSGAMANVLFINNDINFDGTQLPIPPSPGGEQVCDNGIDDDISPDGLIDCADPDCDFDLACSGVVCAQVDFAHPWCDVALQAPTPGQLPATCF
jgi:hypothetical protein